MVSAALGNFAWWAASAPSHAAYAAALDDPAAMQEHLLRTHLRDNADTAFGREHGFADIRTYDQFANRVPIREYDDFDPWIARIQRGEKDVLTKEPVRRLVPTTGSTAARKLVPYTPGMQRQLTAAISPWIFDLFRRHPDAALGPAYWSVTPAVDPVAWDSDSSAVPVGFDDDADYLGGWSKRVVDAVMAVPSSLKDVRSVEAWRYATLLLLLRQRALSLISVWHPSFLQLMLSTMREEWARLVRDVADGTCAVASDLPEPLVPIVRATPAPSRASELMRIGPASVREIWPALRVVSCWADGHARGAAAALASELPGIMLQRKGLLATEGVISIPYAGARPLAIRSHFLEFLEPDGAVRTAAELKPGRQYAVLLTTAGGLCRFRLGDVVEADAMISRTPSVRFVGKAGLISDRVGEKLSEAFVAMVLRQVFDETELRPSFAMLAPEVHEGRCGYVLYVDQCAKPVVLRRLDELLGANPHYAYARRLGQLVPPRAFLVGREAYRAYCDRLQKLGLRLGDIKPAALSRFDGWNDCLPPQSPNPADSSS